MNFYKLEQKILKCEKFSDVKKIKTDIDKRLFIGTISMSKNDYFHILNCFSQQYIKIVENIMSIKKELVKIQ